MREIIFDTETTGFDPFSGDRLVELGALEMDHKRLTGRQFHYYINPEGKEVGEGAFQVHGLSNEFLADKPVFHEVAKEFLDFVGDDGILVAHNADFDKKFINWELDNAGMPTYKDDRFTDTLAIARKKFPGARNSLDALCQRFGIENSHRTLHGALLDSEILAEVYIELLGGKQAGMDLDIQASGSGIEIEKKARPRRAARVASPEEQDAHKAFVSTLKEPIWNL